jgi:hypothetical protein
MASIRPALARFSRHTAGHGQDVHRVSSPACFGSGRDHDRRPLPRSEPGREFRPGWAPVSSRTGNGTCRSFGYHVTRDPGGGRLIRRLRRASGSGRLAASVCLVATLFVASGTSAGGQTIQPPYDAAYTLTDLGPVPRLPGPYGGLAFLPGNPNEIVIGGSANTINGAFYSIGVVRNAQGQITGFSGTAAHFSEGRFNDAGVAFGPESILFYTRSPQDQVGQVKPGSVITDRIIDLTHLGVSGSVGGLTFVPEGGNDVVSIYQFDANGDPSPATRSLFISGYPGSGEWSSIR